MLEFAGYCGFIVGLQFCREWWVSRILFCCFRWLSPRRGDSKGMDFIARFGPFFFCSALFGRRSFLINLKIVTFFKTFLVPLPRIYAHSRRQSNTSIPFLHLWSWRLLCTLFQAILIDIPQTSPIMGGSTGSITLMVTPHFDTYATKFAKLEIEVCSSH